MAIHTLNVKGMHCASCAAIITKKVSGIPGVKSISVNFGAEKARLDLEPGGASLSDINAKIGELGYSLEEREASGSADAHHAMPKDTELLKTRSKTEFTLPVTLGVFVLMLWDIIAKTFAWMPNLPMPMEMFNVLSMALATVVLFWAGWPFVEAVGRFIRYRVANMDTLVGIGTLTAYIYSVVITVLPQLREFLRLPEYTYFDVSIVVVGFIVLGKYLEARSKKRTGEAIEKLLNLQAKTALVLRDGKEIEIPIAEVVHGDRIIVKPSGKIPVDGTVLEGSSYVDESMITGEPIPVEKAAGAVVSAGTLNTSGSFVMEAKRVGSETLLAGIIRMVEEAEGSRAPIQALADRISGVFVPAVIVFSLLTLFTWLSLGTMYLGFNNALSYGLLSFVGILVIACPCALGLATPTAIIVGVGKGAREGILIKDAATLQKLHEVDVLVMDKTGTVTKGRPELVSLEDVSGLGEEKILAVLYALEKRSEHPIAHAIVMAAESKGVKEAATTSFEALKGKGVKAIIAGEEYFAGSIPLMKELGLTFDERSIEAEARSGRTPVFLATRSRLLATILVADDLKPEAKDAVLRLKKLGIRTVMLTGDHEDTAAYIARQVGIEEVISGVTPDGKLKKIEELQAEGRIVAMVGDGVNDAPALAKADVGIAMATGTDVAIESAGITLLNGDISKLVKAIRLSKMTMRGIKQNLFWAFIYNIVGIPLAAGAFYPVFGWVLNPIFAGLAMAFSSVSVVGNSLRLKSKKL